MSQPLLDALTELRHELPALPTTLKEYEIQRLYSYMAKDVTNPACKRWLNLVHELSVVSQVSRFKQVRAMGGQYSLANELLTHLKRKKEPYYYTSQKI